MNISVQMILIVTATCLCLAHASPELRMRTKQQRPTRGFKNVEMMTARGFGKRDGPNLRTERKSTADLSNCPLMTGRINGKREPKSFYYDEVYGGEQPVESLWETLDQPGEVDPNDSRDEKTDSPNMRTRHDDDEQNTKTDHLESITVETFTKEMIKNPDFAKTVVRRFIDRNLDGYLTEDELLKVNA